jgi:hypothetical protein
MASQSWPPVYHTLLREQGLGQLRESSSPQHLGLSLPSRQAVLYFGGLAGTEGQPSFPLHSYVPSQWLHLRVPSWAWRENVCTVQFIWSCFTTVL